MLKILFPVLTTTATIVAGLAAGAVVSYAFDADRDGASALLLEHWLSYWAKFSNALGNG